MKTLVIAEAGVNHNGDMKMARRMIDVAADAGADLVKFQTFSADRLVTRQAKRAAYQAGAFDDDEGQYEMLRRLELTPQMHRELIKYCNKRGIGFFSTAFDSQCIDLLVDLGIDLFKVPSGEITNLPFLRHVGSLGKPVIISTGMATMNEISAALTALKNVGLALDDLTVLHCTTEYPAPMKDVNLHAMRTISDTFGVRVGYSDHTAGIEVAIAAVALGARVIEKHFTLDRDLPGPDHKASLEPAELRALVSAVRNIELALGSEKKEPSRAEMANRLAVRKSLVALVPIQAGEMFTENNVIAKRPGTGISPMMIDSVLGRKAKRAFEPDELIEL